MLTFLDRVERRRAGRYAAPARAAAFITGRYLLRLLAADLVDAEPRALVSDFRCPACGPPRGAGSDQSQSDQSRSDHGRPGFVLDGTRLPLALSLSRAPDVVLLGALHLGGPQRSAPRPCAPRPDAFGLSPAHGTGALAGGTETDAARTGIGVDVESVRGVVFGGFDDVALSQAERNRVAMLPASLRDGERARLWVRKEALVKAQGTGFGPAGPADVEVLGHPGITDLEDCDGVELAGLGLSAGVAVV